MRKIFTVKFSISMGNEPRHTIEVELPVEQEDNGWTIRKPAPEFCQGYAHEIVGHGKTISDTVLNWLANLCNDVTYLPEYLRTSRHN